MKVTVIIEKTPSGSYDAVMDDEALDFLILGQGDTVLEAIADFDVTHKEIKALFQDEKREFPLLSFEYKYDLPSFLEHYSKTISYAGMSRLTGVNRHQLSHYVQGYRKPSKKTIKKIESKLREFAEEISQLKFI